MPRLNLTPRRKALKSKRAVMADSQLFDRLRNTTPEAAEQWVMANVTDLPSAKQMMAKLTKVLVYLLQDKLDD